MSNQWSDKLRKQMETHQEPLIEGLWDDIEKTLLQENIAEPATKPKRAMLWIKRFSATAAILFITLTIGYLVMENNTIEVPQVVELPEMQSPSNTQTPLTKPERGEDTTPEKKSSYADKTVSREKGSTHKLLSDNNSASTPKADKVEQEKNEIRTPIEDKPAEQNPNTERTEKSNDSEKTEDKKPNRTNIQTLPTEQDHYTQIKTKRKGNSNLRTNLYVSNLASNTNNKYSGYNNLSAYKMTNEPHNGENAISATPFEKVQLENQYKEVYTNIEHKQPIVVGATVNYNINDRWSLRSGLTYSQLSSELHTGSDNNYYYSDQTLHYIGIPLSINYNVWNNNRLMVYVSGGGMVQKNISGKLATDYIVNSKVEHSKKENLSVDGLQWSLNTSVGIQYNISDRIGIYFEPGISYYLENKSPIETIYKEKPFNLSLNLGLSFSLGGQ